MTPRSSIRRAGSRPSPISASCRSRGPDARQPVPDPRARQSPRPLLFARAVDRIELARNRTRRRERACSAEKRELRSRRSDAHYGGKVAAEDLTKSKESADKFLPNAGAIFAAGSVLESSIWGRLGARGLRGNASSCVDAAAGAARAVELGRGRRLPHHA